MGTKTQSRGLRVKEGRIELITAHLGKDLTFIYPAKGPDTFVNVRAQLEDDSLTMPTMAIMAETASLVYSAWQNSDNKYSKDIIRKMKDNWLWVNNALLYVPKTGVYVVDSPKIVDGNVSLNEKDLLKRLKDEDPCVRFVGFGYQLEKQTSLQLAKNPFVIALAGKEGAEKLAEVSEKYPRKPYVWSFNDVNEPLVRVACLGSGWDFGGGLVVYGYGAGVGTGRCAFGVSNDKADAKKILAYTPKQIKDALNKEGIFGKLEKKILGSIKTN